MPSSGSCTNKTSFDHSTFVQQFTHPGDAGDGHGLDDGGGGLHRQQIRPRHEGGGHVTYQGVGGGLRGGRGLRLRQENLLLTVHRDASIQVT